MTASPWAARRSAAPSAAAAGSRSTIASESAQADLLGGVGDHRLEVLAVTSPPGPAQSASRSSSVASRTVGRRAARRAAAPPSGSSAKPRASRPRRRAIAARGPRAFGAREGEHLAARGLDRLGELLRRPQLRRLLAGDQHDASRRAAARRAPRPPARPASRSSARPRRRAGSGARRSATSPGSPPSGRRRRGRHSARRRGEASSAPGPPSRSARARRRASAAPIFASSVPAIR